MARWIKYAAVVTVTAPLLGCGGGGGGSPTAENIIPAPPTSVIHRSESLQGNNLEKLTWYANPQTDLPRHGRHGLQVDRPDVGGQAFAPPEFSPSLADRLEPGWRFSEAARERIAAAETLLWYISNMAYFQWTRHLNYDPGQLQLRVGYFPDDPHSVGFGGNIAYYDPERDVVVLTESFIIDNYRNLISGIWFEDEQRLAAVIQRLFLVISHEAAHQFGYENPDGITEGCGGDETRCHAPYGSGSVASYDHLNPSGPGA